MTVDLDAAARFMAAHARVLDRRRFGVLLGNGDAAGPRPSVRCRSCGYQRPGSSLRRTRWRYAA
jgi:hypothetical protein